jgi:membrane-associated phospholipid phosphatase
LLARFAAVTAALALGGLALVARPAPAQSAALGALAPARLDSLFRAEAPAAAAGHAIRWYEPLAVVGGIALLSSLDQPVADHFRDHRSSSGDDVADAWIHLGAPEVYGPVTAGVIVGGLIAHDREVTRAGFRLGFSLGLAAVAAEGLKFVLGRERPDQNTSGFDFDPVHLDSAFPSGHATMAFAMATSLAGDIHRTWATIALYSAATGVAAARVYQQEHWLSDVAGGAAVGIASAKLVSGRWRVFGLRPPTFLVGTRGPVVGWRVSFRE